MKRIAVIPLVLLLAVGAGSSADAFTPASPGSNGNAFYVTDQQSSTCDAAFICIQKDTSVTACSGGCWETRFATGSPIPWAGTISTGKKYSTGVYVSAQARMVRNRDGQSRTACYFTYLTYSGPSKTLPYATSGFVSSGILGAGSWAVVPNAAGWSCV